MAVVYNKLDRDRILEIIEAAGESCRTSVPSDTEYWARLRAKLDAQLGEYDTSDDIEELVDLVDIVCALARQQGINVNTLEALRQA